ncbi:uncharacterized protein LOC132631270 [Lycium barbarum]|uniref:uncharacterized protein LOC132631270 n=1 Tax=Lycium barbarum TaxID=112863 RepID=UPI00293F3D3C|nr:uncharacterized protein LOC132631270 [Lycium barbarum]
MLKNGYFKEFLDNRAGNGFVKARDLTRHSDLVEPNQVVNMIMGGTDFVGTPFVTKRTKFIITRDKRSRNYVPKEAIVFIDEDAEGVTFPHNDALVISVMVIDCQIKRILIDLGSSENITRWKVVDELSILDGVIPSSRIRGVTLNGFNMAYVTVKAEIILPINAGGMLKHTKFYVIGGDMSYNVIFKRPWIHDIKTVPSTLYLLLKFPTLDGVKQIWGEQSAAKEMFAIESCEKKEPNQENEGAPSAEKGDKIGQNSNYSRSDQ